MVKRENEDKKSKSQFEIPDTEKIECALSS